MIKGLATLLTFILFCRYLPAYNNWDPPVAKYRDRELTLDSTSGRNCHSSSSSRRTMVWRRELRSWQITQRVAPVDTIDEAEFLEEPGDDEGVAEVEQQAAEQQALVAQVGGAHLRADVEVAVDGQNWVAFVPDGHREQPVAAALQEPLQQKLSRRVQEGLLAIRGANVLRRADSGGVSHFLPFGGETAVKKSPFHEGALFFCRDTRTMSFGLTRKSLFPPTGMCFFMRLKELKRHSSSPLLFTRKLKSTSSQLYLHTKRPR
ncbi:hypothetical protein EYF80_022253 [Liparis tanakae]|uniref:Uncharacterized protein n=1 Tax=Liparis tanakae TaxID=230148 RepID=A0A4Z2HPQ8_9TELE|nr:hypothetical protein EYF80_022253 [Liparis tanakae]